MKVILTENIPSLGHIGQVVTVADGYARNYLLPKGLALKATEKNVKQMEHQKRMLAIKREKIRQQMMSLAEKLNGVELSFKRKVVEEDKLYGSVGINDIIKSLAELGFSVERRNVVLEQPIKQLGEFEVEIRVDPEVSSKIKVIVERED